MKNIPLDTLQRWMQSVIEHPGSNDEAWHSRRAEQHLPFDAAFDAVVPSESLTPMERIAIYRRMFVLRMTESMAIDYPAVKQFLGEAEFDRLILEDYLHAHPSRSYTLNHLGQHFPEFLRGSKMPDNDFLADLAALELAVTNNLEAEERPLLTRDKIAAVPADRWESVRLVPIAAMQLMEFNYNVCAYLDAVTEETPAPAPEHRKTFAVIYRNNYRTFWEELHEQQFMLLSILAGGKAFGESLAILVEQFPGSETVLQQNLFHWFNDWVQSGLFSDLIDI